MRALDPTVIAQCVAAPDPEQVAMDDVIDPRRAELQAAMRARLDRALERLPPVEAEALRMCSDGMRQVDVGGIFGMSQQRLSYRIARAHHRLRVAVELPELDAADVAQALRMLTPRPMRPRTAAILSDYWVTASATKTARRMGMRRSTVAVHVDRGIACLIVVARSRPELEAVARGLDYVHEHASILAARGREASIDAGSVASIDVPR